MKTVIVSGYFNPIHNGHLDMLEAARLLGDRLIVIVNNDKQVALKGSCPLIDEQTRLRIIRSLKPVDLGYLSVDKDLSITESLRNIHMAMGTNHLIFANGGDRTHPNDAEEKACLELGIEMVFGLGHKIESSSDIINKAIYWKLHKQQLERVEAQLQK